MDCDAEALSRCTCAVTARRPSGDPLAVAITDRIARAKTAVPPRDPTGRHHAEVCEIARKIGSDPCFLLDEWDERSAIREYLGNVTRNEAESRAIDDIRASNFRQTEII